MYKGSALVGKPIITYTGGKKIDTVSDLLFDSASQKVLGFLVDPGGLFSVAKILPLDQVRQIGEDAVIVENEFAIRPADHNPELKKVMEKSEALKGTTLLTDEGKEIGTLKDIFFNEKTGEVEGYEVSGGMWSDAYKGRTMLPADQTLTIGKDVAFVPAQAVQQLITQKGGMQATVEKIGDKAGQLKETAQSPETKDKWHSEVDAMRSNANELWEKVKGKAVDLSEHAKNELEESKVKKALGRPVNRIILDKSDQIILPVGEIITHQAVERAREAGVLDILLNSVNARDPEPVSMHQPVPAPPKVPTHSL